MPDVKISQFSTAPTFNATDLVTGLQGGINVNWAGATIEAFILSPGRSFATQMAAKAPLDSPVFVNNPQAPTQPTATNNTLLATTAFVHSVVAAVSAGVVTFNGRAGAVMPQAGDYDKTLVGLANVDNTSDATKFNNTALTGSPTAPTAAAGTNSTVLATTAFVMAAVAASTAGVSSFNSRTGIVVPQAGDYDKNLVGLGNVDNTSDANKPISTAQAAVNTAKADLNNPALTGVPTAPTAAAGTSTTQIATTAFVQQEIAAFAKRKFISANPYTVIPADDGQILVWGTAGPLTFNVATGLRDGFQCEVWQDSTGVITFQDAGGAQVHSRGELKNTAGQYAGVTLCHIAGGQFRLAGDLA